MGNYSNRTGYAWNNIYRLYNVIAKTMHENGFGICLSFANIEPPVTFIDKEIPIKSFLYDPINFSCPDIIRLFHNIKKYNIKYVYATDLPTYHFTYPVMRMLGVKAIVIHNRISVDDPYLPKPETGIKRIIKYILTRVSYINSDKVYCVSDFVKYRLINKGCMPKKNVVRILNGININKYSCPDKHTDGFIKIYSGARASIHKGIHILFEAAYILVNKYNITNYKIDYAGDGPEIHNLQEYVRKHNLEKYINFLGELSETHKYVCESDIIVVPSIWGDACPSAVSEALAAGKPLITTRAGGIPEIVGDETNAIIIEPGNAEIIARKIVELIKSPELRINYGRNARLRAESALDERDYYSTVISQLKHDYGL